MAKKKTSKKTDNTKLALLIRILAFLVIGLLFILNIATNLFSLILGIVLIISGVSTLYLEYKSTGSITTNDSSIGILSIAVGVYAIVEDIVALLLSVVPYIIMIFGLAYLIDGIAHLLKKESKKYLVKTLLGLIAFVLGILMIFVPGIKSMISLLFGIALVVEAVYLLFSELLKK